VEQHDVERTFGSQYIRGARQLFRRHVVDVRAQYMQVLRVHVSVVVLIVVLVTIDGRLTENYAERIELSVNVTRAGSEAALQRTIFLRRAAARQNL
jgi:hypothetical protein